MDPLAALAMAGMPLRGVADCAATTTGKIMIKDSSFMAKRPLISTPLLDSATIDASTPPRPYVTTFGCAFVSVNGTGKQTVITQRPQALREEKQLSQGTSRNGPACFVAISPPWKTDIIVPAIETFEMI